MDETKHLKINEARWDKWAETVDGKSLRYDYLRSAQSGVISLLNLKENVTMLDIGCGTGWALGQAAKLIDGKGTFYGVDLSEKMIEKAKEKIYSIKIKKKSIPKYIIGFFLKRRNLRCACREVFNGRPREEH